MSHKQIPLGLLSPAHRVNLFESTLKIIDCLLLKNHLTAAQTEKQNVITGIQKPSDQRPSKQDFK